MTNMIVEIMVEVLTILTVATNETKRGRISELMSCILPFLTDGPSCSEKYFMKLTGNRDIEDSLKRLDKLTEEEARLAGAELLKMTHSVDGKVTGVDDRVRGIAGQVQDVRGDVQDVRRDVQDLRVNVQDVHGDVRDVRFDVQGIRVDVHDARGDLRDVGNMVQDVEDKLDQANSSSSL
jgi:archaellum component FlaC